jgi:hypothetical protein
VLHVTSVKQETATDWCTDGKCVATRYIVEGYRPAKSPGEVIRYLLECVEIIAAPEGTVRISCARVAADGDYDVKILADAIFFEPEPPPKEGTSLSAYLIRSQREEKK